MKLRNILKEVLTERKQVGRVYHFTNFNSALQIVQSNLIKASRATKNIDGKTISTTRDNKFSKSRMNNDRLATGGIDVSFALNGDLLSDRYQVMPYDDAYDKTDKEFDLDDKEAFGDEMEEVWYGKTLEGEGGFRNMKKYVFDVTLTKYFLKTLVQSPEKLKPKYGENKVDELFPDIYDVSISPQEKIKQIKDFFEKEGFVVKLEK